MFYNKSKNTLQFGIILNIEASVLETVRVSFKFPAWQAGIFSEFLTIPESN
jgi:hypothetical protein